MTQHLNTEIDPSWGTRKQVTHMQKHLPSSIHPAQHYVCTLHASTWGEAQTHVAHGACLLVEDRTVLWRGSQTWLNQPSHGCITMMTRYDNEHCVFMVGNLSWYFNWKILFCTFAHLSVVFFSPHLNFKHYVFLCGCPQHYNTAFLVQHSAVHEADCRKWLWQWLEAWSSNDVVTLRKKFYFS